MLAMLTLLWPRVDYLVEIVESPENHDLLLTVWWVSALVVLVIAIAALVW